VAPAQTVCNYWNYWFTMLPEHLTERDQIGFQQRIALVGGAAGTPEAGFQAAPLNGYSGKQANGTAGPAGDPLAGVGPNEFAPTQLPILHGNPYGPGGEPNSVVRNYASKLGLSGYQRNYNEAPDCQSGQVGYPLGNFPAPGQSRDNPAQVLDNLPGSRGVTDVFFNKNGDRVLKDTRIPSHQP
jgi:hypothetical protein